jgi:DNA-directed RNA polymerase specialized sigma24 family protein
MSRIEHAYTRYLVDGDVRALDDLLDDARRIAISVARRLGCEDAEDIAQQASIIVWQKLRDFDPRRASLSTWIGMIVRRLVIDQYRAAPPHATVLDEAALPQPPRLDYDLIDTSHLSYEDRRAVAVLALGGDFESAAATLAITVPALKKRLHRIGAKNRSVDSVSLLTSGSV